MDTPTDGKCQRCSKKTDVTSMSRFNTQHCCMECLDIEKKHPMYATAESLELAAVKQKNYNFPGIGLPPNYNEWVREHMKPITPN